MICLAGTMHNIYVVPDRAHIQLSGWRPTSDVQVTERGEKDIY